MRVERNGERLNVQLGSETETVLLGEALASVVTPSVVIALVGPLGAGKTRLSRAIAEALGVDPMAISSPTFGLIHEYDGRLPVYHFDTYRLDGLRAFEDLGVADYWNAGGICLVEWADRVRELLPAESWWITIEPIDETHRSVTISAPPGEGSVLGLLERLLPAH